MPVEWTNTSGQEINFGTPTILDNIDQKTVSLWFNLDAWGAASILHMLTSKDSGTAGWKIDLVNLGAGYVNRLRYVHEFSGDVGVWRSDQDEVSAGTIYHLAVTYDRTSTANDPLAYLDGALINFSELLTPTGTTADDSAVDFLLGEHQAAGQPFDGKMWDIRIYDSILPANLIADIFNKKSYRLNAPFPIFRPSLLGAAGLQVFDGASLGGTNYIIDDISGIQGTPANSPIGRDGTHLAYSG